MVVSGSGADGLAGCMGRDELAQLLLCYIGVAADIIEFFDSFKVKIYLRKYENLKHTINTHISSCF